MIASSCKRGLTRVELLAVAVIVGLLICVLLPACNAERVAARRASCLNNMKQLGLAFKCYENSNKMLPPASRVTHDASGAIKAIDGCSFLVCLLPYIEMTVLYNTLDVYRTKPFADRGTTPADPIHNAMKASITTYCCPSHTGGYYEDPDTKLYAITNYKGMGASHYESLTIASPAPQDALYPPNSRKDVTIHPDGACFPGNGMREAEIRAADGCSNTLLLAESIDTAYSRWVQGAHCVVYGLNPNDGVRTLKMIQPFPNGYWAPDGFTGTFDTGKVKAKAAMACDNGRGPTQGKYLKPPEVELYGGVNSRPWYGPSSSHTAGVNHVFADGSATTLVRDIDAAAYMFLITRNGGGEPQPPQQ